MSMAIAEHFLAPVDISIYPSYAYVVEYPIDLSTIKVMLKIAHLDILEILSFCSRISVAGASEGVSAQSATTNCSASEYVPKFLKELLNHFLCVLICNMF